MKLVMKGNTEIRQFKVTEHGLYVWRLKLVPNSDWIIGHLGYSDTDSIDGQYEGCGPIEFVVE